MDFFPLSLSERNPSQRSYSQKSCPVLPEILLFSLQLPWMNDVTLNIIPICYNLDKLVPPPSFKEHCAYETKTVTKTVGNRTVSAKPKPKPNRFIFNDPHPYYRPYFSNPCNLKQFFYSGLMSRISAWSRTGAGFRYGKCLPCRLQLRICRSSICRQ